MRGEDAIYGWPGKFSSNNGGCVVQVNNIIINPNGQTLKLLNWQHDLILIFKIFFSPAYGEWIRGDNLGGPIVQERDDSESDERMAGDLENWTHGRCLEVEPEGYGDAVKERSGQRVESITDDIQVSSGARPWASLPPLFLLLSIASMLFPQIVQVCPQTVCTYFTSVYLFPPPQDRAERRSWARSKREQATQMAEICLLLG